MRCMLIKTSLFRRIEIQLLMNLTARAIGKPSMRLWRLPNDKALRIYALYTRSNLQNGVDSAMLQRMNDEAFKMGRMLRRVLLLRNQNDVEQFIIGLYHNIGIELEGHIPGNMCFRRCFFCKYYTPAICLAASALDDGIMRGLSGRSGKLSFQKRITEGCENCLAVYR